MNPLNLIEQYVIHMIKFRIYYIQLLSLSINVSITVYTLITLNNHTRIIIHRVVITQEHTQ